MNDININGTDFSLLEMKKFTNDNSIVLAKKDNEFNSSGEYMILKNSDNSDVVEDLLLTSIKFQKGPVNEVGLNGCFIPDVLQVVINELEQFQRSDYRCPENTLAIKHLYQAVDFLRKRTEDRRNRGVLGKYDK